MKKGEFDIIHVNVRDAASEEINNKDYIIIINAD
jgi:hypothetical protein